MMPVKAVCPPEDEEKMSMKKRDRFEHEEEEKEEEGGRDKSIEDGVRQAPRQPDEIGHGAGIGSCASEAGEEMKKSASSNSAFRHFSEAEIVEARRPATTREAKAAEEKEDEEVDSKADDFINKFKQQLKLQRLDSILRYKEMLGRGAAK
ncbi:unnamed protein product [Rhodiola kirilowii]